MRTTFTIESTGATNSTAANAFSAQISAKCFASSIETSAPTFPVCAISPLTKGNCPAVKTKLPVLVAGVYAAKGFAATGRVKPFSANLARTSAIYLTSRFM